MSDEMVREYLQRDNATTASPLVNPFTRLSGGPALVLGLLIVAATVAVAVLGKVHYDGLMDVHVGPAGEHVSRSVDHCNTGIRNADDFINTISVKIVKCQSAAKVPAKTWLDDFQTVLGEMIDNDMIGAGSDKFWGGVLIEIPDGGGEVRKDIGSERITSSNGAADSDPPPGLVDPVFCLQRQLECS